MPEQFLSIVEAVKLETGRTICSKTALRWAVGGVRAKAGGRAVLKSKRIGGRLCTTTEWVREWIEATNAPPEPPKLPRTGKQAVERFWKVIGKKPKEASTTDQATH